MALQGATGSGHIVSQTMLCLLVCEALWLALHLLEQVINFSGMPTYGFFCCSVFGHVRKAWSSVVLGNHPKGLIGNLLDQTHGNAACKKSVPLSPAADYNSAVVSASRFLENS